MDASVFNNKLMLLQILLLVWMVEVQGVLLREATHVAIGIDLQLLLLKNLLSLDMMRDLTESSVDDSAGLLLSLLLGLLSLPAVPPLPTLWKEVVHFGVSIFLWR